MKSRGPLLSIRDLTVSFRDSITPAVSAVSFDIFAGETVAIVGESGSGKSTTAAAVNRLLPVTANVSGSVVFDGQELTTATERHMMSIRGAGIGLVPQDPMSNLDPLMTVGNQVAEALRAHDQTLRERIGQRVVELLDMVGIPDPARRARQYPHEFSGGMRQRVLIAMALSCQPRLLIADEPTSALDVTVQKRILDELAVLTSDLGTAVMLITHDLGIALERADRVLVLQRGQIVEVGETGKILRDPEHAYTKQLLKAVPSFSAPRVAADRGRVSSPAIIKLVEVRKEFSLRPSAGQRSTTILAVDDVNFEIRRGEAVSIVGESGSGKSTVANILLGLERATAGEIVVDDKQLSSLSRRELVAFRRKVQPVFQNPYASLDPRWRVVDSIIEPLRVHKIGNRADQIARAMTLLDQVALSANTAKRYPHELSGGQQQRVAIARALALSPDLVVLDEAVSALDVLVQAQILDLLAELNTELNLSYLFISHDLAVVRLISDYVHVMRRGRIIESGTPEQIFDHPTSEYTKELLAAIPGIATGATDPDF